MSHKWTTSNIDGWWETGRIYYTTPYNMSEESASDKGPLVDTPVPFEEILDWYTINYLCSNCGHWGFVAFKKGVRKHLFVCSKCKCFVHP